MTNFRAFADRVSAKKATKKRQPSFEVRLGSISSGSCCGEEMSRASFATVPLPSQPCFAVSDNLIRLAVRATRRLSVLIVQKTVDAALGLGLIRHKVEQEILDFLLVLFGEISKQSIKLGQKCRKLQLHLAPPSLAAQNMSDFSWVFHHLSERGRRLASASTLLAYIPIFFLKRGASSRPENYFPKKRNLGQSRPMRD